MMSEAKVPCHSIIIVTPDGKYHCTLRYDYSYRHFAEKRSYECHRVAFKRIDGRLYLITVCHAVFLKVADKEGILFSPQNAALMKGMPYRLDRDLNLAEDW